MKVKGEGKLYTIQLNRKPIINCHKPCHKRWVGFFKSIPPILTLPQTYPDVTTYSIFKKDKGSHVAFFGYNHSVGKYGRRGLNNVNKRRDVRVLEPYSSCGIVGCTNCEFYRTSWLYYLLNKTLQWFYVDRLELFFFLFFVKISVAFTRVIVLSLLGLFGFCCYYIRLLS